MIRALAEIFSGIVRALAELLPAGPDITGSIDPVISSAVAFVKSLDPLLAVNYVFQLFLIVIAWDFFKMGWDASIKVYDKLRGSG